MKLIASTTSPFVRKVLIVAHELGLAERIQVEYLITTVLAPNPKLGELHPLIKLPTLVTDDGVSLYDSRVIVEYLQSLVENTTAGVDRFLVLRTQALADGILDAAVLVFYERMFRAEELRSEKWLDAQADKARRGLAELEATMATWARTADGFDVGQIAVASACSWLDFREPIAGVRAAYPALFAWFDSVQERPSMQATALRLPPKA
jgi:glutathione S-transferase